MWIYWPIKDSVASITSVQCIHDCRFLCAYTHGVWWWMILFLYVISVICTMYCILRSVVSLQFISLLYADSFVCIRMVFAVYWYHYRYLHYVLLLKVNDIITIRISCSLLIMCSYRHSLHQLKWLYIIKYLRNTMDVTYWCFLLQSNIHDQSYDVVVFE